MIANLRLDDLAERTGMSVKYWQRKVSARAIPFTKFGRAVRFTEDQIALIIASFSEGPKAIPTYVEASARRPRKAAR